MVITTKFINQPDSTYTYDLDFVGFSFLKGEIKSPLRYPGGKSRAIKKILPNIPVFEEYREPFVGGGSVFLSLLQRNIGKKYLINDLNPELYAFWKIAKENNAELVHHVQKTRNENMKNGRKLYENLKKQNYSDYFNKAVRFFIMNRITFSGLAESGGFSKEAFEKRFTDSSIDRLKRLDGILDTVNVYNLDYSKIVNKPGNNVFIFLDPPYYKASKSKLYGKQGLFHLNFNHEKFAKVMKNCNHKWLITYDDSPYIRELFDWASITEWNLQYGMNNYKQIKAKKGRELFISNYSFD